MNKVFFSKKIQSKIQIYLYNHKEVIIKTVDLQLIPKIILIYNFLWKNNQEIIIHPFHLFKLYQLLE